jgi:hydrogenase nickel incorporation protein HypA/HybF
MEMVDMAIDRAEGRRVRSLRVAIGELAAIETESIRFCFDACSASTLLEGASLVLERVVGRARCRDCLEEMEIHRPYGQCRCGSGALEVVSGHEVILLDVEVI